MIDQREKWMPSESDLFDALRAAITRARNLDESDRFDDFRTLIRRAVRDAKIEELEGLYGRADIEERLAALREGEG